MTGRSNDRTSARFCFGCGLRIVRAYPSRGIALSRAVLYLARRSGAEPSEVQDAADDAIGFEREASKPVEGKVRGRKQHMTTTRSKADG